MVFWQGLQQSSDPESGYLSYQYTDQLETSDRVSLGISAEAVIRPDADARALTDGLLKAVQKLYAKHEPSNGLYIFLPDIAGGSDGTDNTAVTRAAQEVCTTALQKALNVASVESADGGALK